jgi:uncharacterized membrane protein YgcG
MTTTRMFNNNVLVLITVAVAMTTITISTTMNNNNSNPNNAAISVSAFSPTTTYNRNRNRNSNARSSRSRSDSLQMSSSSSSEGGGGYYVDINERSPRNVGPFDDWTTSCGVQRCEGGFRLVPTNPTGDDQYNQDDISVMTDIDLPAGQPVLSIPANMILSSTTSRIELEELGDSLDVNTEDAECSIRKAVDLLQRLGAGDTVPKFYLFLKVLLEYSRGIESPYYPWLDSLPRLYYNSVSMTDSCYECLPPLVFQLSRRERVKFDNFYDAIQLIDSRIFNSNDLKTDKDHVIKWAFNVVHTRCFSGNRNGNNSSSQQGGKFNGVGEGGTGGEEQKIVPMADMVRLLQYMCVCFGFALLFLFLF